jgi:hypothetical protein
VSEAEEPQSRPSSEAVSARVVYDDIVRRINKFQATLKPDEKMVLSVDGIATDAKGLRGATIWFQGRNNQGYAVAWRHKRSNATPSRCQRTVLDGAASSCNSLLPC